VSSVSVVMTLMACCQIDGSKMTVTVMKSEGLIFYLAIYQLLVLFKDYYNDIVCSFSLIIIVRFPGDNLVFHCI